MHISGVTVARPARTPHLLEQHLPPEPDVDRERELVSLRRHDVDGRKRALLTAIHRSRAGDDHRVELRGLRLLRSGGGRAEAAGDENGKETTSGDGLHGVRSLEV